MQPEELNSRVIERLRKQGELLLKAYQAELAKDSSSLATESSRSNVIAYQHTVIQMYGEAALRLPVLGVCAQAFESPV